MGDFSAVENAAVWDVSLGKTFGTTCRPKKAAIDAGARRGAARHTGAGVARRRGTRRAGTLYIK